ncbi:uncharacterized protein LOC133522808 [Cydia pomonella]|uniref:uncharacterized protein LOC133522808 n=1 Tax=Cydia pomonella TaxID=82600 RepID=UPI002ADE90E7|nr:uncharacterized protein LOC133522808 [Cydia pomonella]
MLLSRLSFLWIFQLPYSDAILEINFENNHSMAKECIRSIINVHYKYEVLTFFNFNARSPDILQAIHETNAVSIITRRPHKKSPLHNRGYLIYALNADDFLSHFPYLLAEGTWKPDAPFIAIMERLELDKLHPMFHELLRVHVTNVVIIDALTTNAYSYDPFRNHGCGKRFDIIIELGKCFTLTPPYFFSNPSKKILQNCTLQVAATNWPPFTIDRTKNDIKTIGMDEYILSVLGELENFKVNITYFDELSDVVSDVSRDMVVSGPLGWLQENKFDVVTGSQMLLPNRAEALDYLYGNLIIEDYFAIFVRKSGLVPGWKLLTLAFRPLVWVLLLVTFVIVISLIILLSKSKDKVVMIFCLIDNLLMHTCRIQRTNRIQYILFSWIIFATLMPYHYLSVLYSLTTKPMYKYQIGELSDISKYGLRPCISDAVLVMQRMITGNNTVPLYDAPWDQSLPCATLSSSLEKVAKSDDMFTVVPYYMYYTVKYDYYDKYGQDLLYPFRQSLGKKIIYSSFMYKGFPHRERLFTQTTRIHTAGLTLKVLQDYAFQHARILYKRKQQSIGSSMMIVPWQIIVSGSSISFMCFLGEIFTNRLKINRTSNIITL